MGARHVKKGARRKPTPPSRLAKVERQEADRAASQARRRVPSNVLVHREAPGVYAVHVNVDTLLFGSLRPRAGTVRRDRTTRLWAANDGTPVHATRDEAVLVVLEEAIIR